MLRFRISEIEINCFWKIFNFKFFNEVCFIDKHYLMSKPAGIFNNLLNLPTIS